jgi:arsenite methyltransferase
MEIFDLTKNVRQNYASVAKKSNSCCTPENKASTCGCSSPNELASKSIGYSEQDMASVPEGANLGLGCGNPVAIASLKKGEVVLDLGSGAGFDCFLAAQRVGPTGKVIGVDMTPEMLDIARENVQKGDYKNVEFRLGEIENLPVADNSVDVIISNCVINLSIDKGRVFEEAFRVLRSGGRVMVSDIVLQQELPPFIKDSMEAYVSCVSGAMLKDEYLKTISAAGFKDVKVAQQTAFPVDYLVEDPQAKAIIKKMNISEDEARQFASSVLSVRVQASKG